MVWWSICFISSCFFVSFKCTLLFTVESFPALSFLFTRQHRKCRASSCGMWCGKAGITDWMSLKIWSVTDQPAVSLQSISHVSFPFSHWFLFFSFLWSLSFFLFFLFGLLTCISYLNQLFSLRCDFWMVCWSISLLYFVRVSSFLLNVLFSVRSKFFLSFLFYLKPITESAERRAVVYDVANLELPTECHWR